MALRNVVKKGDPILRKKCREVEKFDDRLGETLDDMVETMRANDGVGLAAPQIGLLRRMCVIEPEPGYVKEFLNPVITEQEGEQEGYEGCLSVPEVVGKVTRPYKVTVKYQTRTGEERTETFEEFDAVVVCHEFDHLDGILYIDKASDIHDPDKRAELMERREREQKEAEREKEVKKLKKR